MKEEKHKIKRALAKQPAAPLLQVMPAKRVRIDPSVVDQVATWVYAIRLRHVRALEAPRTETTDIQQHARARRDDYHRTALKVLDDVLLRIRETISSEDIGEARDFIELVRSEMQPSESRVLDTQGGIVTQLNGG